MFIQYRKIIRPFTAQTLCPDGFLHIVYPAPSHATVVPGQDFYVMGTFARPHAAGQKASLTVSVLNEDGQCLRRVATRTRDAFSSVCAAPSHVKLETGADAEEIRQSGMPDLVFDAADPESVGWAWNKAFMTNTAFAVLIYGGLSLPDVMKQTDESDAPLEPFANGIYTIQVELSVEGTKDDRETSKQQAAEQSLEQSGAGAPVGLHTAQTQLRVADNTKETIVSRYTDLQHLENVKRFAKENGFETYVDPCAGNWAPEYFPFDWPGKAEVEIPERWHLNDALEYRDDVVHCFDYMLSKTCVGYATEVGMILYADPKNADDPERVHFYYYKAGSPQKSSPQETEPGTETVLSDLFGEFKKGEFLAITGMSRGEVRNDADVSLTNDEAVGTANEYAVKKTANGDAADGSVTDETAGRPMQELRVMSVVKPIPSKVRKLSESKFEILNRIVQLRYTITQDGHKFEHTLPVGRHIVTAEGKTEFILMESQHQLMLPENFGAGGLFVRVEAIDKTGKVWDAKEFTK